MVISHEMNLVHSFVSVALVPAEAASRVPQPAAALPSAPPLNERPDAVKLELKGTTIPVIAVMIPARSLAALEAAIEAKVGGARAFFEGEAALLDVSRCWADASDQVGPGQRADARAADMRALDAAESGVVDVPDVDTRDDESQGAEPCAIDYVALAALVRRYGLIPVAVRGAPEADAEAVKSAGLALVAGAAPVRPRAAAPVVSVTSGPREEVALVLAQDAVEQGAVQGELGLGEPGRAAFDGAGPGAAATAHSAIESALQTGESGGIQAAPTTMQSAPAIAAAPQATEGVAAASAAAVEIGAMVIDKALRSGQRVYAKGRDLVVLAQVNPGAELIADGSIHCYAPLRGRAVAGANGNTKATIFASNFQAELVSIAGVYKTFETIPREIAGRQMCVRLREQDGASRIALDLINTE